MMWKLHKLILSVLFLLCIKSAMAQESTLVQIKTFDLNLKSISNLVLSLDNQNYFSTEADGSIIIEVSNALLPPKIIYFRDVDLEAESWNYSQGVLEIIVRKKSFETYQLTVVDTSGLILDNVIVKLNADIPVEGTTNNRGVVQLIIPVELNLQQPGLFKIIGYRIVETEFIGSAGIITTALIPPVIVATTSPIVEVSTPIVALNETHLDSLSSLTAVWNYIRGLDMTNLTEEQNQLIDNKFNEVGFSDSLNQNRTISGRISDSTLVVNDLIYLTEQAILESRAIVKTRDEFNKEIGLISEKITDGGGNLSDDSRDELLAQLDRLDGLLVANEILFAQNQDYYKSSITDLKNSLLNIEDLERQLTDAEKRRLDEQDVFRRQLLIVISVSIGLSLLVLVFIYLMRKVSNQKKELVVAHSQVKNTNDNLEL